MKQVLFGLILNEGESDKLLELCIKENIPITFPDLFKGNHKSLWGFNAHGIGGVGTIIMRHISSCGGRIIRGINELERFFKTDEWKECKKDENY